MMRKTSGKSKPASYKYLDTLIFQRCSGNKSNHQKDTADTLGDTFSIQTLRTENILKYSRTANNINKRLKSSNN